MTETNTWFEDYSSIIYAELTLSQELYERSEYQEEYLPLSLYHAQQSVEKAIKLFLVSSKIASMNELIAYGHFPLRKIAEKVISSQQNEIRRQIRIRQNKTFSERVKLNKLLKLLRELVQSLDNNKLIFLKFVNNEEWKRIAGKNIFRIKEKLTNFKQELSLLNESKKFLDKLIDKFIENTSLESLYSLDKQTIDTYFQSLHFEEYIGDMVEELLNILTEEAKIHSSPLTDTTLISLKEKLKDPKYFYQEASKNTFNLIIPFMLLTLDENLSKLIYIFPFSTYGRYIEPQGNTTTLRLIVKKREEIGEILKEAKIYVNTLYIASKFYNTLEQQIQNIPH